MSGQENCSWEFFSLGEVFSGLEVINDNYHPTTQGHEDLWEKDALDHVGWTPDNDSSFELDHEVRWDHRWDGDSHPYLDGNILDDCYTFHQHQHYQYHYSQYDCDDQISIQTDEEMVDECETDGQYVNDQHQQPPLPQSQTQPQYQHEEYVYHVHQQQYGYQYTIGRQTKTNSEFMPTREPLPDLSTPAPPQSVTAKEEKKEVTKDFVWKEYNQSYENSKKRKARSKVGNYLGAKNHVGIFPQKPTD